LEWRCTSIGGVFGALIQLVGWTFAIPIFAEVAAAAPFSTDNRAMRPRESGVPA
jgi:hypothetical protein